MHSSGDSTPVSSHYEALGLYHYQEEPMEIARQRTLTNRSTVRVFPRRDPLRDPIEITDKDTPLFHETVEVIFPLVKAGGEMRRYYRRTPGARRTRAVQVLDLDGCITKIPSTQPRKKKAKGKA